MTHYLLHRAVFNVLHNLGNRNLLGSALLTHEGEKEYQHANHDDYPDETIPKPLVICHVTFLLYSFARLCGPGSRSHSANSVFASPLASPVPVGLCAGMGLVRPELGPS